MHPIIRSGEVGGKGAGLQIVRMDFRLILVNEPINPSTSQPIKQIDQWTNIPRQSGGYAEGN